MRAGDPTVAIGADRVDVTPRERALLEMFGVSSSTVLGKSAIAKRFSAGEPASSCAVEILVHRLRKRLAPYGISIVTLRGVGYRLQFAEDAFERSHSNQSPTLLTRHESKHPDVPVKEALSDPNPERWDTHLLEFTNDAIIIWEMEGQGIVYWNRAAELLYGYSREEACGQVTHSLLRTRLASGEAANQLETALARYGIWVGELYHTTRDGREVEVEGRLALMSQQSGRWLVLEVNRDVTDRRKAEAARLEVELQLASLRSRGLVLR